MKINLIACWVLAAFGLMLCQAGHTSAQTNSDPLETSLADVNGVPVTRRQLRQEADLFRTEMNLNSQSISSAQINDLHPQLLENLIERELLYQDGKQKRIQIKAAEVDGELKELKAHLRDAAGFNWYLASAGISEAQLNERLRIGLTVHHLLRAEVLRAIRVKEDEMQAFYNRHPDYFLGKEKLRALHILVAVKDESRTGEALMRIKGLQSQLQQGANFAALALEQSDCPSKSRGGDLGYLTHEQMIPSIADAAFALQDGQVSDIIESRFGYHLIKVLDRIPPRLLAFKEVRDKIEFTLRQNKENAAVHRYLDGLKAHSAVVRHGLQP